MSSIQSPTLAADMSSRQTALSDSQFSSYVRKQTLSAYESLDAGLTIKTKEGDLVTLTSNSYAGLDAFMYNSKGVLQSESGTMAATQNHREITLTSGDSFSFSVVGDLSEEELSDIESIVKGIDEVISEMAQGNMDDAVATALSMGGYDTVSMYSADITHEKSYQMTSETQSKTIEPLPEPEILSGETPTAIPSVNEPFPENHRPAKKKHNSIKDINHFIEKMAGKIEKSDEKLIDKVQKPIDKLFKKYLQDVKDNDKNESASPKYNAIDDARKQVEKMIDKMVNKIFKENLSTYLE